MNEESTIVQDSAITDETVATEKTVKPKKKYITPQMDIEYFEVEDIITSSVETTNHTRANGVDSEGNEPDDVFDW